MKKLILGLVAALSVQAHADIKCKAIFRDIQPNGTTEEVKDLRTTLDRGGNLVLETDLRDRHFALNGNSKDDSFWMMITNAPEYLRGVISTSSFGVNPRIQVSTVDNNIVYKLECFKR